MDAIGKRIFVCTWPVGHPGTLPGFSPVWSLIRSLQEKVSRESIKT